MEEFLLWLQENLGVILTGAGLSALAGYISYWFTTKVVPRIINSVVNMFAKLVSNLFGVSYGEGQDLVNALPVVQKLNDVEDSIIINAEMKLIEYKQKINSPAFTAAEKAPYQATFDYLYNKFKEKLSPEVLLILNQFEEASRN